MTVTVRLIMASDRATWGILWAQYNAFYGRHGETALDPNIVETTWTRLLDPGSPVHGLVAMKDEKIVGLVHAVFHLNLIQTHQTCYMQDLFTEPSQREGGIGTALISGVADLCRSRGVKEIYWHTHSDNLTARKLYDRLANDTGFIVYRMAVE